MRPCWPTALVVVGCLALANLAAQSGEARLLTVRQAGRQDRPVDAPSASVSADGRYVAFASNARLTAADTNDAADIYVLDIESGSVSLETGRADGRVSFRRGSSPSLSGDGRFLVYETTVVSGAEAVSRAAIAFRDRSKQTTHVLCGPAVAPDGGCSTPVISADGRRIVFTSSATILVSGPDSNGAGTDVYVFERDTGAIRRVSVDSKGQQLPDGSSFAPAVSGDGRYVAFVSSAPLDPMVGAAAGASTPSAYLRDTLHGITTRISVAMRAAAPNGASYEPSVSSDGRWITFTSEASNLAPRDSNHAADIFLYDRDTATTLLVSRSRSGGSANGRSLHPAISGDGRMVAFQSDASDLMCGRGCSQPHDDINLVSDVFLFDRTSSAIRCISRSRQLWMEPSIGPAIDGSGWIVAFSSRHPVHARDVKEDFDLYVRVGGPRSNRYPFAE